MANDEKEIVETGSSIEANNLSPEGEILPVVEKKTKKVISWKQEYEKVNNELKNMKITIERQKDWNATITKENLHLKDKIEILQDNLRYTRRYIGHLESQLEMYASAISPQEVIASQRKLPPWPNETLGTVASPEEVYEKSEHEEPEFPF